MMAEQQYEFSEEGEKVFRDYLARRMEQPRFANARGVRNALERARLRQASRIVSTGKTLSKGDLMRIEADDIRNSRVFSDEEEGPVAASEEDEASEESSEDTGENGSGNGSENGGDRNKDGSEDGARRLRGFGVGHLDDEPQRLVRPDAGRR